MKRRFVLTAMMGLGLLAVVLPALEPLAAGPQASPPVQGGCPDVNAIANFQTSTEVTARIEGTDYFFMGTPKSGETGLGNVIPGLIQYCVYPKAGSLLPSDGGADYVGWTYGTHAAGGYFSFKRPHGDPTNVPYRTEHQIGHASCCEEAPVILLHVNDPAECDLLYGGNPGTCFVYPVTVSIVGGEQK